MSEPLRNLIGMVLGRRPPSLQVGALCLQPDTGRVLLITSRDTGRWIIPKGWPMTGRSAAGAAQQEAWEEAGVRGRVSHKPLGRYSYLKKQQPGLRVRIEVQVHLIHVTSLAEDYPEAGQRERHWLTPEDAAQRVEEPELKALIRSI